MGLDTNVAQAEYRNMVSCADLQRICVFCGARPGVKPIYLEAARELGALLANRGIGLVYGGGSVGLMGALASAALDAGGDVIGVIPRALMGRELSHPRLKQLHVVDSMHARKALMAEYADAFIALPGGFGTLDELFEIITWAFLGIHCKPIALVNTHAYFQPLLVLFEHLVKQEFAVATQRDAVVVRPTPKEVLHALLRTPPSLDFTAGGEQSVAQ